MDIESGNAKFFMQYVACGSKAWSLHHMLWVACCLAWSRPVLLGMIGGCTETRTKDVFIS